MSEDVSGGMIRFHTTCPRLCPVDDLTVVFAQDARTLRDQQEEPGGRVVDRFRHRGDHVAGQVRLDARHQRPGDDRTGHELIR